MEFTPVRSDGRRSLRYHFVAWFWRTLLSRYFGRHIHIEGLSNLPSTGPLILAGNHLSLLDPLIVGAFVPNTMFAMAKKELFENPFLSWLLRGSNVFPVDRGSADRGALKMAIEVLTTRKGTLLLFVEGTRAPSAGMKRAESGVGFLHRKSGARIVPVATWGTEKAMKKGQRLPKRVHMHIRVGEPFSLPVAKGRGQDQEVADEIARRIAVMLPEKYRGEYAAGKPGAVAVTA